MKVCDRHNRTRAVTTVVIQSTDTHLDVCDECLFALMEWIGDVNKATVEPKKKKKGIFKNLAKAG